MRASTKAIAAALVASAAYAPIAVADGGSATPPAPSLPAVAALVAHTDDVAKERTSASVTSASDAVAVRRRCRSTARRRLVRVRRASLSKRERATARKRVRRKLRSCLAASRRMETAPPAGQAPIAPQLPTSPVPAPTPPGSPLPSFVGVTASDDDGFRLTLSRPAVAAGNVTIELRNTDSGPHDLVVEPDGGGAEVARFDPVEPDAAPSRKAVTLPAGRWRLYCSLPNHALAGMQATLRAE